MRNTPGFGGYLLAIVVSWIVFALVLSGLGGDPGLFVVVLLFTGLVGTPVGAVGVLVVHGFCAAEPRQLTHVLAAGAAGMVIGLTAPMTALITGGPSGLLALNWMFLPALMALAAAIGRASVIPLVHARRRPLRHSLLP